MLRCIQHQRVWYVLDGAAKTALPIADKEIVMNLVVEGKPQQVKLAAAPPESYPMGQASRFTMLLQQLAGKFSNDRIGALP
jgi:hypothetical protein